MIYYSYYVKNVKKYIYLFNKINKTYHNLNDRKKIFKYEIEDNYLIINTDNNQIKFITEDGGLTYTSKDIVLKAYYRNKLLYENKINQENNEPNYSREMNIVINEKITSNALNLLLSTYKIILENNFNNVKIYINYNFNSIHKSKLSKLTYKINDIKELKSARVLYYNENLYNSLNRLNNLSILQKYEKKYLGRNYPKEYYVKNKFYNLIVTEIFKTTYYVENRYSIIIYLYNNDATNTLNSIYKTNNSENDIEVIVVNDNSTDTSLQIVEQYIINNKINNLKIINNSSNLGESISFNKGIYNTTGEYICIMYPYDILSNNRIKNDLTLFKNKNSIYSKKLKYTGEVDNNIVPTKIINNNGIFQKYTQTYKRIIFSKYGFFIDNKFTYDIIMLKILKINQDIHYSNTIGLYYKNNPNSAINESSLVKENNKNFTNFCLQYNIGMRHTIKLENDNQSKNTSKPNNVVDRSTIVKQNNSNVVDRSTIVKQNNSNIVNRSTIVKQNNSKLNMSDLKSDNYINYDNKYVLVILPTFNRSSYIKNIILMMNNQTYKNFNLLIIDDGSNNIHKKNFNNIREKNKNNSKILFDENNKNLNIANTLNKGLRFLLNDKTNKYKFVTWISDDNIYHPNFLEKLVTNNKFFKYSAFNFLNKFKKVKNIIKIDHKYNNKNSVINNFKGCASFMWTIDAIKEIGFYNTNVNGCEDWEYLVRTFNSNNFESKYETEPLMDYILHNDSLLIKENRKIMQLKKNLVKICNFLNNNKQNIIYYSKTKYKILFQRPQQIMRFFDKSFNKVFIGGIDNVELDEKYGLLIVPYKLKDSVFNFMNKNDGKYIYYTDSRLYNEIIRKNEYKKIYDLIDAPINEFKVWKPNLEKCVKNSDYVIYSHTNLVKYLNEIDNTKDYKYISNACDYEHFSKSKDRIGKRPNDFPQTDKPILGYYGSFAKWLDYDIIRKYADEGIYHIVMIGGIPSVKSYDIRFKHSNITWLDHKPYDELPYYLSWFDKCFLPFKDCELTKYVNPCKLWEYMASGKEIIKYNVNMDVDEIVTYEDVCKELNCFIKKSDIKKSDINLSIVLLCFNKLEYTRQCIDSVLKNTINDRYELIVVNNGSTDGTYDYLNEIKSNNIIVIHNESNLGFSKGMNIGAKNANGKYLILLNNDTIVGEGWDIELIKTLESNNNIFAVTPITSNCGNKARINITHNSPDDFFKKVTNLQSYLVSQFDSDSLALFCGCFRNDDLKNIGYLDENFLNGWEDDDLYERILLLNKKVVISTKSVVYHYANITVGKNAYSGANNPNKLYFEKKWNKKWKTKYNDLFIFDSNNIIKEYISNSKTSYYILTNTNKIKGKKDWLLNKVPCTQNSIEIDDVLYKYLYKVEDNIYKHIHDIGIKNGYIYTIRQLKHHFGIQNIYKKDNKLFCKIENHYVELGLVVKSLQEKNFEYFINDINLIEDKTVNIQKDIIVCFIGNYEIGTKLLNKIAKSSKNNLPIVLIFRNNEIYERTTKLVQLFKNRIVFISKEYGNDIIPTLQAINYMLSKYNIQNIYKFHTKSDEKWFNECTDYLLNNKMSYNSKSNCTGHPNYYLDINDERYHCKAIINKNKSIIDKKVFVRGTIFYTKVKTFSSILNHMKTDYLQYFINNCYDTNAVLLDNSPCHFLERLFGIVELNDPYCITKENKSSEYVNNKLWAHLHCYDIDKFDEIYGEYIENIMEYFSVVVTYSKGDDIPNHDFNVIKIDNKYQKISISFTKKYIISSIYKNLNKIIVINPNCNMSVFINNIKDLMKCNYNIKFKNNFIYTNDNDTIINILDINLFLSKNISIPQYTTLYIKSNSGFTSLMSSKKMYKYFLKKYSVYEFNTILSEKKNNILVFDFAYCGGGSYMYLQNIIGRYKKYINFIIIRGTYQDNKYLLTVNDDYYIDTYSISEIKSIYEKQQNNIDNNVFINSLATFSQEMIKFIFSLNKYLIGISHDFSVKYNTPQPLPNENKIPNENIKYDLLLTQTPMISKIMDITNNINVKMPDYYKYDSMIKINNNKINIAVIGSISTLKGIIILKDFIDYLKKNNLENTYNFKIFGNSHPYLQEYNDPYIDINDLNSKLIHYKPNIIIETSIWQETWSYTLTLSTTLNLPILYFKKNFSNTISYRLKNYNKAYEWETNEQLCNLINIHKQDHFFTIKNEIIFPDFYDSLFLGNYIENLIIITSKIIVNQKIGYTYTSKRSIANSEERLKDTINTIKSVRDKFKHKNYKILLIDNSEFNNDYFEKINKNVDIFLHRNIIPHIDNYTDFSKIKGLGEAKQQQVVNNWVINNKITFKNLFKISGRYILNDNFKYENYDNNKCNFKLAVEVIKKNPMVKDYYYTSIYKIHFNYIKIYNFVINTIVNNEKLISNTWGYECILAPLIMSYDNESILNLDILGLNQNISCWKKEEYSEQINI